jgi:murein DD-endopeptidase MepM/ murein hydrolase activator NlpD
VRRETNVVAGVMLLGVVLVGGHPSAVTASPAFGTYEWPVKGPIIRFFEPPPTPYSAGHRGIDIAVPFGTPIHAPADGIVTFAGWVAGAMFVTLDHGDGVKTSYSWLSGLVVKKGDSVHREEVIAFTGHGHPEVPTPHLHFSARLNGVYVDPLLLLKGLDLVSLIRLAPLVAFSPSAA